MRWVSIIVLYFFVGCDSSNEIPIEKISTIDIVSNEELQQKIKKRDSNTYYFGFDSRNSPQKDAAQYVPLMKYLERKTGLKFKLHFTSKNSSSVADIGSGKTQFALMGAMGFLKAQMKFNAKILVRGINKDGESKYRSFFVTRIDSPINNLNTSSRLAFGNRDSTQGNLIPRIEFKKSAISLESFSSFGYTESHQKCAEAVISRKYDICAMQDQLAEELSKQRLVKIIYRSSWYPSSGVIASSSVKKDILTKVKNALLEFDPKSKDKKGLYNWESTEMPLGFTDVGLNDYDDLRKWAIKLGVLQKKGQGN